MRWITGWPAVLGWSRTARQAIVALTDEQQAQQYLQALTPEWRWPDLQAEAERRADLYRRCWYERPEPAPHGHTALAEAYRSVAADVAAGRL